MAAYKGDLQFCIDVSLLLSQPGSAVALTRKGAWRSQEHLSAVTDIDTLTEPQEESAESSANAAKLDGYTRQTRWRTRNIHVLPSTASSRVSTYNLINHPSNQAHAVREYIQH